MMRGIQGAWLAQGTADSRPRVLVGGQNCLGGTTVLSTSIVLRTVKCLSGLAALGVGGVPESMSFFYSSYQKFLDISRRAEQRGYLPSAVGLRPCGVYICVCVDRRA